MDGQMDGWRWMEGWMGGWIERWTGHGWGDEQMDRSQQLLIAATPACTHEDSA